MFSILTALSKFFLYFDNACAFYHVTQIMVTSKCHLDNDTTYTAIYRDKYIFTLSSLVPIPSWFQSYNYNAIILNSIFPNLCTAVTSLWSIRNAMFKLVLDVLRLWQCLHQHLSYQYIFTLSYLVSIASWLHKFQ